MSYSCLQKPLEFSVSFSLSFTEILFVGSHTETLTCMLLISDSRSPYWLVMYILFQLSGIDLGPSGAPSRRLSPSFKAKRNRSQSAGQQNTFSLAGSGTHCWSCSRGCSALISLSTVLASVFFSSTGIYLADASVQCINSRAFLEVLLPSCSKERTSWKPRYSSPNPSFP